MRDEGGTWPKVAVNRVRSSCAIDRYADEYPGAKRKEIRTLGRLARCGRRYWLDVYGRQGWRARYLKEVDVNEATLQFWQEIYDEQGMLTEIHVKYPVDKGHQKA
jgi:hypothetical protein